MKSLLILLTLEVRCLFSYYWLQEFFVYSGKGYPVGDMKIFFSHAMTPTKCLIRMQTWKHTLNLLAFCDLWFLCSREFCSFEGHKSFHFFFSWKIYSAGFIFRLHDPFRASFCLRWKLWTGICRFARCASNCPAPRSGKSGKTFTQWLDSHNWKPANHSCVALSLISHPHRSFLKNLPPLLYWFYTRP